MLAFHQCLSLSDAKYESLSEFSAKLGGNHGFVVLQWRKVWVFSDYGLKGHKSQIAGDKTPQKVGIPQKYGKVIYGESFWKIIICSLQVYSNAN